MRPHPIRPLRATVCGSTSNLGTGFDTLGLALQLPLRVRMSAARTPDAPTEIRGVPADWPAAKDTLLVRAFECVAGSSRGLVFDVESEIPVARGLGSSGASVAAGLLLGARSTERTVATEELSRLGIELEGHPDNVTASLLGGCTLCLPRDGEAPLVLQPEVHADIGFVVAWNENTLSTEAARAALPAKVPLPDAVENARRLPYLLEGLRTGDPELLFEGGRDRLHERYRLPLIEGAAEALDAATKAGAWLATISGSGSALVALVSAPLADRVAEALGSALGGARATARILRPGGAGRVEAVAQ